MIIDLSGGTYITGIGGIIDPEESLGVGLGILDPNRQFLRCDMLIAKNKIDTHLIRRQRADDHLITRTDFSDHNIKRVDSMEVLL